VDESGRLFRGRRPTHRAKGLASFSLDRLFLGG
jgi:hypothetical protein